MTQLKSKIAGLLKFQKTLFWLMLGSMGLFPLIIQNFDFSVPALAQNSDLRATGERGVKKNEKKNQSRVKKRPSSNPNSPGSPETQKKSTRSPALEEEKAEGDFPILTAFKIAAGGFLTLFLYFYLRQRPHKMDQELQEKPKSTIKYIAPKPLVLDPPGIDPATKDQSGLIRIRAFTGSFKSAVAQKLSGSAKKVTPAQDDSPKDAFERAVSLFGPDNTSQKNAIKKEVSALTNLAEKLKEPEIVMTPKLAHAVEKKPLKSPHTPNFPDSLAPHFEPQKGEKVQWHQTYFQGSNEGTIAVTTHRLLHVYHRQNLRLWPPGVHLVIEKSQHPLLGLKTIRKIKTRQDLLLIAAAPFVVWFPLGTIAALVLVSIYVGWTKENLGIGVSPKKLKTYHLPLETQELLVKSLMKSRKSKSRSPKG